MSSSGYGKGRPLRNRSWVPSLPQYFCQDSFLKSTSKGASRPWKGSWNGSYAAWSPWGRCNEHETLPHVLGFCPQGELLRIDRHNTVRPIIANRLREQGEYEVYEEVQRLSTEGSTRRADVIIIDRDKKTGLILDPAVRSEINEDQPKQLRFSQQRRCLSSSIFSGHTECGVRVGRACATLKSSTRSDLTNNTTVLSVVEKFRRTGSVLCRLECYNDLS
ncbi:hypothetical protein ANN_15037 [Periplaneta americana]|uniref:Uncharacterized protein n=1 Tax=Periplaneta americana TaxID=6978 RepID=A0ABQ8T061_PERAM|nr:hypothetical protein ANN_15037 [Periplaneta americana]